MMILFHGVPAIIRFYIGKFKFSVRILFHLFILSFYLCDDEPTLKENFPIKKNPPNEFYIQAAKEKIGLSLSLITNRL